MFENFGTDWLAQHARGLPLRGIVSLGLLLGTLSSGDLAYAQAPKAGTADKGAAATAPATPAAEASAEPDKFSAKNLIANDVADADTPQYKIVNDAIAKFLARDVEGARKLFREAKTAFPKLPPEEILMARLFAVANAAPQAKNELEQAVRTNPTDPEAFVVFGQIALSERRVTDADCILDRAGKLLETYADNPVRKKNLQKLHLSSRALVAENRKQWDEAKKYLEAWIALDTEGKESAPHTRLGAVLFQLGKQKEAWDSFNKAAKDKNAISPNLAIAMMFEQSKDRSNPAPAIKEAKKFFDLALKEPATENKERLLRSHILAAQWALSNNDLEYAKTVSGKALSVDPNSQEAQLQAAILARFTRELDKAEKLLDDLHDRYPGNFQVANQLALVLAEQQDASKRQRGAEMAEVTFNSNKNKQGVQPQLLAEALTTVAVTQYKIGNVQQAAKILQELANSNALNSDSAYYVARILADSSKIREALQILENALKEPVFVNKRAAQELFDSLKKKIETDAASAPKGDAGKTGK